MRGSRCVGSGGTGDEQAAFHMHRDARAFAGNGQSYSLGVKERHVLGSFQLTPINGSPERVRADGTVYWEARHKEGPSDGALISMVVGESWMIESTLAGLKFVLYISTTYQLLPGSALPVRSGSASGDFIAKPRTAEADASLVFAAGMSWLGPCLTIRPKAETSNGSSLRFHVRPRVLSTSALGR